MTGAWDYKMTKEITESSLATASEALRNLTLQEVKEEEEEYEQLHVEKLSEEELVDYARYGEIEILNELIRQDLLSRLQVADSRGNTMLHMFAANGHLECLKLLLEHVPNLDQLLHSQNAEGNTALHWACMSGQLAAVQILIVNGAKVSIENKAERTPVCEAHKHNRTTILAFFEGYLGNRKDEQLQQDDAPNQ